MMPANWSLSLSLSLTVMAFTKQSHLEGLTSASFG